MIQRYSGIHKRFSKILTQQKRLHKKTIMGKTVIKEWEVITYLCKFAEHGKIVSAGFRAKIMLKTQD